MKKTMISLAVLTAATCAMQTQADNRKGFYAGGGVSLMDTGIKNAKGGNLSLSTVEGLGGYKFNSWLGAEFRLGTGLSGGDNESYDYSVTHYESIYWRPETVNQTAKLYGLVGFTNIDINRELKSTTESETLNYSGMSYGFGVGFVTGEKSNLNFEYKTFIKNSDLDMHGLTVQYDYRF